MGGPTSLSSSLFSPGNLFNSPSLLSAQDPFYALTQSMGAASGSTSNSTMDLLQKCKLKFDFTNFFILAVSFTFLHKNTNIVKYTYIISLTHKCRPGRMDACTSRYSCTKKTFPVNFTGFHLPIFFIYYFMYFHVKTPKLDNAC